MNVIRKEKFGYLLYSENKQQSIFLRDSTANAIINYMEKDQEIDLSILKKVYDVLLINEYEDLKIKILKNKSRNLSNNYLSAPIDVIWCYTHNCSLSCTHCYIDKNKNISMGKEYYKYLISELSELGVFRVSLTGGEPLENLNELEYILQLIQEKQMVPYITTNAIYINKKAIDLLNKYNIKKVQVSMDIGFNEKRPNYGLHKKMIDGVDKLIKNKIIINPIIVLSKNTINHMDYILKSIIKAGIKYVKFERLILSGEAEKNSILLSEKTIAKLLDKLKDNYSEFIFIDYSDLYASANKYYKNNIFNNLLGWDCEGGRTKLYIDVNGNCSPCVYSGGIGLHVGNINKISLKDIWENSIRLNEFRNTTAKNNSTCQNCDNQDMCIGACKTNSLKYNGTLCGPDSYCMSNI